MNVAKTFLLGALLSAVTIGQSHAQTPLVNAANPAAVAPGKTTEITFFGDNLSGATTLWTSFPATVKLKPGNDKNEASDNQCTFQLTLPAEVSVGIGAVRLATTNGVSSLRLLMIDDLPGLAAREKITSIQNAQPVKLPVAIDGACEEMGFSFFKFNARKGESISVEAVAQRLGSPLDPVVRLLDANGRELVYCDDDAGSVGGDARFRFQIPATGQYVIELHDLAYQGGPKFFYHLRLGNFPLANAPFPLGVKKGSRAEISFAGQAVEGVGKKNVQVPESSFGNGLPLGVKFPGGNGSGFVHLVASDLPQVVEREPNDKPEAATKIAVPCIVNGRFGQTGDRDYYQFEAAPGERVVFSGRTRSLGAPCDLWLRLFTRAGALLAESSITNGTSEGTLSHTFREAGTYRLLVEELNHLAGPEMVYGVAVERSPPGFALSVETAKVEATNGGTFSIKVSCARQDYTGPITLALADTGADWKLEDNIIAAKATETTLKVRLPVLIELGQLLHFRIVGQAAGDQPARIVVAGTAPAWRELFPLLLYPPPQFDELICLGIRSPTARPTEVKPAKKKKK